MPRTPLPLISALLAASLLAACSSTPEDKTAGWSPAKIYSEARDELSGGAYDKAVPLLEKLEGRAAGTRWPSRRSSRKPMPNTRAGKRPRPSPRWTAS